MFCINSREVFVCSKDSALVIEEVCDEKGENILSTIEPGNRFFTPHEKLEKAMALSADYDAKGFKTG